MTIGNESSDATASLPSFPGSAWERPNARLRLAPKQHTRSKLRCTLQAPGRACQPRRSQAKTPNDRYHRSISSTNPTRMP